MRTTTGTAGCVAGRTRGAGRTRRRTALTLAGLAMLGLVVPPPAAGAPLAGTQLASSTTGSCGLTWGSLQKVRADGRVGDGTVVNVRSGRHTCFDRVVIDLSGVAAGAVGYRVRYVDTVTQPGSGTAVPLAGGARMQVDVTVPAYDSTGRSAFSPRDRAKVVDVTGYDTLRQVAIAGSFEGQTTVGVGVRARLPMRVFVLEGPGAGSRLVLDVAHRW